MKRGISTTTLLENFKKLWNIKMTIVLIVIGAFGTITKGLLKGLEDLEVGGRVSNSSEKPSANTDVKNSKGVNNNNNKENQQNCWLCGPGWPQNKTKRKWKER